MDAQFVIVKVPSMSCLLVKARLRHLKRLIATGPKPLIALLALRYKGLSLPWVSLILKDLQLIWKSVSLCSGLGDPRTSFHDWISFMRDGPRWKSALASLCFIDELHALEQDTLDVVQQGHLSFKCSSCSKTFATARARDAHARVAHQTKVPQRFFTNAHGTCQVCKTTFHTYQRLLRHLCDSRRDRCWKEICKSPHLFEKLSDEELDSLIEANRLACTEARRNGLSHPVAKMSARTSACKRIGRTSA